jgi:hypothetical protein
VKAASNAHTPVSTAEADVLERIEAARPKRFWARFWHGFAQAARLVSRQEFDRACLHIHKHLDGQVMFPDDAQRIAQRLIVAHTGAECATAVSKCQVSDTAMLVIRIGAPRAGFLFERAMTLKDPKGAKRG